GGILISDLAVANPICGNFTGSITDSIGHGYDVVFSSKSTSTTADTLSWMWNFGDPTSGTRDTSTLQNPVHKYTAKGTYQSCFYLKVKRANGLGTVCTDTICNTVVLVTSEVSELGQDQISVIP